MNIYPLVNFKGRNWREKKNLLYPISNQVVNVQPKRPKFLHLTNIKMFSRLAPLTWHSCETATYLSSNSNEKNPCLSWSWI